MPTTRRLCVLLTSFAAVLSHTGCQSVPQRTAETQTRVTQQALTPSEALEKLKSGNQRFAEGRTLARDLVKQRAMTASGQYPFAVVLSCLDSRCSSEQVFDQGIGDIVNARIAGNVLNEDILGSMEFACQVASAKLVAVIGHSKCGAIQGARDQVQLGHLTGLLAKIQPAVTEVASSSKGSAADLPIDEIARANVRRVMS